MQVFAEAIVCIGNGSLLMYALFGILETWVTMLTIIYVLLGILTFSSMLMVAHSLWLKYQKYRRSVKV